MGIGSVMWINNEWAKRGGRGQRMFRGLTCGDSAKSMREEREEEIERDEEGQKHDDKMIQCNYGIACVCGWVFGASDSCIAQVVR
jgi:hypothetical protein